LKSKIWIARFEIGKKTAMEIILHGAASGLQTGRLPRSSRAGRSFEEVRND
jgi:hypothetical protein